MTYGQQPFSTKMHQRVLAQTADTEATSVVGRAPRTGTVTAVSFIPAAAIDGDDTNSRTFSLVNKGTDGSGTTEIAALTFPNANNAVAFVPEAFTVASGEDVTDADVTAGDVLALVETTPGTGVANPGGVLEVTIGNSAADA